MANYNKKSHDLFWTLVYRVAYWSNFFARLIEMSGHVASFATWQKVNFNGTDRYLSREAMLRSIFPKLRAGRVTVMEFGVAQGSLTRFWLTNIQNRKLEWHGFDVFTGLPETWSRGGISFAKKGTFTNNGKPPEITDTRLTWHVGLVEKTLPKLKLDRSHRKFLIFDFDLYNPTKFALNYLEQYLRKGDLLYFDEAYDPEHERRVIDEFCSRGHNLRGIGVTGTALLLEYTGKQKNKTVGHHSKK